jgi:replicative DNA helicase
MRIPGSLLQKFIQRELIRISGEIIGDAYEDSTDVFDMLDDAESKLFEITNNHLRKNFDSIDTVLVKTIQRIEDMRNRQDDITGVPTGFASLDKDHLWLAAYRSDHPGSKAICG